MEKQYNVYVKLNQTGWELYKRSNAFFNSNKDENGYSMFSYDYFEKLFFPLSFSEFADDVISDRPELKVGIERLKDHATVKEIWEKINDDIENLYGNLRGLNRDQLKTLDRLMINRNKLNGILYK